MRAYLFLLFVLFSCSGGQHSEPRTTRSEKSLNFGEPTSTHDLGNGLMIRNVLFSTNNPGKKCEGVSIHCIIEPSEEAIEELKRHAFSSFLFVWKVFYNEQNVYDSGVPVRKKLGEEITFNQAPFITNKGSYPFEKHMPFSALGLSDGEYDVVFSLEVYAVKFAGDPELKQYKKLEYIASAPLATRDFKQTITTPRLYKGQIGISHFKIDNPTGKKYDFTLTDNGMPDPFWELCRDSEILYSSKPARNTYTYAIQSETPYFLLSASDTMTINIYDFDQGPFNSKDFIDAWHGTFADLQREPLKNFGLIRNLRLQAHFTPIEKNNSDRKP